jgi:hypothetical protein
MRACPRTALTQKIFVPFSAGFRVIPLVAHLCVTVAVRHAQFCTLVER